MTWFSKATFAAGILALLISLVNVGYTAYNAGWSAGFYRCMEGKRRE